MPTTVIGKLVGDRTDDRELVGDLRVQREMLADIKPRHVRGDGTKLAAIVGGSVGLQVVHLHVGRTARQPDEDD